jgi:2-polyprenyl-6-methoxyphenol hydroxylase-like FAD-dependent oxidoreductase
MQTISIVGGGIGGVRAAIALNSKGFSDDGYERSAAISDVGSAIRVFRQRGFQDQALETGGEVKQAFIRIREGKILAQPQPAFDLRAVAFGYLFHRLAGVNPKQYCQGSVVETKHFEVRPFPSNDL